MPKIPDITAFPLMRFGLRHAVIERDGMLWIDLAAEGAVTMLPTAPRIAGLFEVSLLSDGASVPYTYGSDGFSATLECPAGTAKITHDKSVNALRLLAKGVSLRLDAKSDMGVSSLNIDGGAMVGIGGGKYFFKAIKGTLSFDDAWIRNAFHSVTPVVNVEPENGELELIAYELPADTKAPAPTQSFDACAAENKADFEAFLASLAALPEKYAKLREKLGMLIWKNLKALPNGHRCVAENRLGSTTVLARQQSVAALAFKSLDDALDVLLALPDAAPPLHGVAASRLLAEGLAESVGEKPLRELYFELLRSEKWWREKRSVSPNAPPFYAYSFESSLDDMPHIASGVIQTADLSAYLSLLNGALATLAARFGDNAEAERQENLAATRRSFVMGWDADAREFKPQLRGVDETCGAGKTASLMTLVLGNRQKDEIAQVLAQDMTVDIKPKSFAPLAILGILDAGQKDRASELAENALENALSEGVTCPIYAAGLIALASRAL